MNLEQIDYIIEIVKTGSFTKAASNLYITQPALCKSIDKLELELGFKIFNRTKNGSSLTQSGLEVYEDCIEISKLLKTASIHWNNIALEKHNKEIEVTIQILPMYQDIINSCLYELAENYPLIKIHIEEKLILDILSSFTMNNSMTLISLVPSSREKFMKLAQDTKCILHPLLEDELIFFASSKHTLTQLETVNLDDLQNIMFASYGSKENAQQFVPYHIQNKFQKILYLGSHESRIKSTLDGMTAIPLAKHLSLGNSYRRNGYLKPLQINDLHLPITHTIFCAEKLNLAEQIVYDTIIKQFQIFKLQNNLS